MTLTKYSPLLLIGSFILVALFLSGGFVQASAPSGLPATIATTSQATISTAAQLVFATSTCASRIVSTTGNSGIMIGFGENQGFVPNGLVGHFQAASTTVEYDSGQYGCGAVRIFSYAAQTLTVAESR